LGFPRDLREFSHAGDDRFRIITEFRHNNSGIADKAPESVNVGNGFVHFGLEFLKPGQESPAMVRVKLFMLTCKFS